MDAALPPGWEDAVQCWQCWAWFTPVREATPEQAMLAHLTAQHPVQGTVVDTRDARPPEPGAGMKGWNRPPRHT